MMKNQRSVNVHNYHLKRVTEKAKHILKNKS